MDNLEDGDLEEFYSELLIEEQDLRILKALVSSEEAAREFTNTYGYCLFVGGAKDFGRNIVQYIKTYGTLPTRRVLLDEAEQDNTKQEINFIWDKLDAMEHTPSEFGYDLDKLKNRHAQGKLTSVKAAIEDINYNTIDYDDAIRGLKSTLDEAEKIRKGGEAAYVQKTLKEYMPEFRGDFIAKHNNTDVGKGIMSGFSFLDYVTNGLEPSDLWIIGGETGAGKSFFLANLAAQIWMQGNTIETKPECFERGYNIQFFSLEMPYDQCVRRTMARLTEISTYALRDGNVSDESKLRCLGDAAKFIDNYPHSFEVVDIPRGVTVNHIEERFLEAVNRGRRPDVIVVDYLGLMEDPNGQGDDWLKLGHIAGQLHEFARAHNVAVLTAVQLNRARNGKSEEVIGLHRIGRSSLIMHHATVGIQIETRQNEETFSDLVYHVIKNRNGERGQHTVVKKFAYATIKDIESFVPQVDDVGGYSSVNTFQEDISDKLERLGWAT